jgi:hypothetical protein
MIKLSKFYKEIRAGSSLPLIVGGSDGIKYVVKPRGSGDGLLANVVERLAIELGRLLQIPVLKPEFLIIDADLVEEVRDLDPEIRELLERSVGINLGTVYLEDASTFNEQSAFHVDNNLKNNIFLYDLFLLNIDRNSRNTNMVISNNKLRCLDYSSSVTVRNLIDGKSYRQEEAFLKEIKTHPFYSDDIVVTDFIEKLKRIEDKDICDLVDRLPEKWVCQLNVGKEIGEMRKTIGERLLDKKNEADLLERRLEVLKRLKVETEEERRLRLLKNKKAFEEKLGRI